MGAVQQMQPKARRQKLGPVQFAVCNSRKVLQQHLGDLQPGHTYVYLTGGKWSNHQLLQYLLEKTGPADVYATTWTITEAPVRVMQQLLDSGAMRSLTLLTDHRITSRAPQAWQLMQTLNATVHLSKCHAKVTVAIGDTHGIVVINSQNMTNNPRIEAGTVLFDRATAEFMRDAILSEVQQPELIKLKTRQPSAK
jgi:hypothetical protein